jgi:hypothetical protein
MNQWDVLQIDPTTDEHEIRKAYARALKTREHESDPVWFERLRSAYETALRQSQKDETEASFVVSAEHGLPVTPHFCGSEQYSSAFTSGSLNQVVVNSQGELNNVLGLDENEDPRIRLKGMFERLQNDLQGERPGLEFWREIAAYPALGMLVYREQITPLLIDLLARHWPVSRDVWIEAQHLLGWQCPGDFEIGATAEALRWLFDANNRFYEYRGQASYPLDEEARARQQADFRWDDFVRDCGRIDPNPFDVLMLSPLMRCFMYFVNARLRVVMHAFIESVNAMGADGRLEAATALAWWGDSFSRRRITCEPVLFGLLVGISLMLFSPVLGGLGGVLTIFAVQYGALPLLERWRHTWHARVLRTPVQCIGGLFLFFCGCSLQGFWSVEGASSAILVLLGLMSLTVGFVWTWLVCYPSLAQHSEKYANGRWWTTLRFLFFCGFFVVFLRGNDGNPHDLWAIGLSGVVLAAWMVLIDYHAWKLLANNFARLGRLLAPRFIMVAAIVLGGADIALVEMPIFLHSMLISSNLLLACFGWSYVRYEGWELTFGTILKLLVVFALITNLATGLGLVVSSDAFPFAWSAIALPLLGAVAYQCFRVMGDGSAHE